MLFRSTFMVQSTCTTSLRVQNLPRLLIDDIRDADGWYRLHKVGNDPAIERANAAILVRLDEAVRHSSVAYFSARGSLGLQSGSNKLKRVPERLSVEIGRGKWYLRCNLTAEAAAGTHTKQNEHSWCLIGVA